MSSVLARTAKSDEQWRAVLNRDAGSDGLFVYAVRTTGGSTTGRLLAVGEAFPWGGVTAEVVSRDASSSMKRLGRWITPRRLRSSAIVGWTSVSRSFARVQATPWRIVTAARELAELHARIHRCGCPPEADMR